MDKVLPYAKCLVGALVAFTGAVATGYADDSMTRAEWWFAISTGLTALGVIFGVPNKDPKAQHQHESVQPPDGPRYAEEDDLIDNAVYPQDPLYDDDGRPL